MSVATGERVAVIIVSYNTRDETLTCVESLRAATTRPLEIVVVDNGSLDGSAAALREAFPDITVVEAGANLGFAAGVNLGVESSTAPWVLLLNPDTVVLPAAVDAIVEFAERNPAHGVYGGRTLRPDGTTDPSSCWGRMTLWSLTSFALGLSTVFKRSRLFDPESLGTWQRDTVREVPVITGCLLLTSREDWHRIGGMDERFFLYGEDAEFSARAIERGMRPVIVPEATIIHAVGGSTSSSGRKMAMVMAGKATVLRTAWSRPAAAIGVGLLQAGAALRAAPAILRKRPDSTWAVVWRSRKAWRDGYPKARQTIFGQQPPAGDSPTGSVAASSPAPSAEFMQIWEEGYLSRRSSYEVMHLPYVLVLDGAPLRDMEGRIDRDRIRDYVARTLASTPTFRLRLQRPLLGLTPPAWVPDADFDLSRHLSFASEVVDFKTADV
ncbi:MAG: glycosyltransferase, partial [Microbacterium pygmaeum]